VPVRQRCAKASSLGNWPREHQRGPIAAQAVTTPQVARHDDGGAMTGVPIHGWQPRRVREHLGEEIPEAGDPCLYEGRRPCIFFGMRDYAEDWSGWHVRELQPSG
jgi:hypothetical protein